MLLLTKHFRLTLTLLLTTFMITIAQVAPVISPIGGFNIDGYLERQGPGGDWLKGSSPLDGPGSFVFSTFGSPMLRFSYGNSIAASFL